ncbi:hypothetical protein Plec18167_008401 [Paecilomyces lecythidis]|uniref:C2H2-type domain-containing protein n=1 Tax=Paecilomyces lecythidis TaxID=3004212 RepID=A0ABR3WXL8_9EURO
MEEDFNSSDLEFEAPAEKFPRAGFASIQKMQENKFEDRARTKMELKTLTDQRGAPGTQYSRNLVMKRFDAFRETSENPPDGPPTGDEVIRFVDTLVHNVRSTYGDRHAISKYTVRNWLYSLSEGMSFRYQDYKMTRRDRIRLDECIASLVKEGKLIKGKQRKPVFVGVVLLQQMARSWIEDGLENGCRSWDIRISRLLSVVLMQACCCRAGEIVQSVGYTGKTCLLYEHIEMVVTGKPYLESTIMRVSLYYTKGEKDAPYEALEHIVKPYGESDLFVIDAVKLLLIHSLRQGACASHKDRNTPLTTLDEVLRQAYSRRDKKVIWRTPQRPVICAIDKIKRRFLTVDTPANVAQVSNTVRDMGLIAGVCQHLTSHAIRYGSARDLAHVPADSLPSTSTEFVARALGHSTRSMNTGVTQMYMGGLGVDTNIARAAHPYQDPLGPVIANESMKKRKRAHDSSELTKWCEERGLDPLLKSNRRKAGRSMSKSKSDVQRENAVMDPMTDRDTLVPSGTNSSVTHDGDEAFSGNIDVPNVKRKEMATSNPDPALLLDTQLQTGNIPGDDQVVEVQTDNFDLNMAMMSQFEDLIGCEAGSSEQVLDDDQELHLLMGTSSSITPDNGSMHMTGADELDTTNMMMHMEPEAQQTWTQMSGEEFIRFFSKINTVHSPEVARRVARDPQAIYNDVAIGNSRDPPTIYEFRCKTKFVNGSVCDYTSTLRVKFDYHSSQCDPMKPPTVSPPPAFVCPDCGKAYANEKSLRTHVKQHTHSGRA